VAAANDSRVKLAGLFSENVSTGDGRPSGATSTCAGSPTLFAYTLPSSTVFEYEARSRKTA